MAHQVKLSDRSYDRLTAMGKKNETYDNIILRLLDEHDSLESLDMDASKE